MNFHHSLLTSILLVQAQAIAGNFTIDFNTVNPAPDATTVITNPWTEDGMKLRCREWNTTSLADMVMLTQAASNTSQQSPSIAGTTGGFYLSSVTGVPFTPNSIRIFPINSSAANKSITFYANKASNNSVVQAVGNTGTSLSGTIFNFPSTFTDITELRWGVFNNQSGTPYHQFDDIDVTYLPFVTVPDDMVLSEGSGPTTLILQRDSPSTGSLDVSATLAGTATSSADYTTTISNPYTFSFTGNTASLPFQIELLTDTLNESPESLVINWASSSSHILSSPTTVITIGDTNGTGYDDYVSGHGLTGNNALPGVDPNKDGITNLEAYTFRLNPAGTFPAAWRDRLPRFEIKPAGKNNFPAITWQLPQPWPSDVRFIVEESELLGTWQDIAQRSGYGLGSLWTGTSAPSLTDTGTPTRTVTVSGSQAITARPTNFLRLKLEKITTGGAD